MNVNLGNRFLIFGLVFKKVILEEGVDFAFADGLDFGGNGLDEGEVEELGHDFSFVFPGLSF